MISLLPLHRVIVVVATVYACVIVLVLLLTLPLDVSPDVVTSIRLALAGGTILNLLLLAVFYFGWKWLWKKLPILGSWLFPDLNGNWKMTISWFGIPGEHGKVQAEAVIRQDFLRISMEVLSPGSESETLMAQPKKDPESGRPVLYYVYRVIPKRIGSESGSSYEGAAILKFSGAERDRLEGNYFTSRQTQGHFVLTR